MDAKDWLLFTGVSSLLVATPALAVADPPESIPSIDKVTPAVAPAADQLQRPQPTIVPPISLLDLQSFTTTASALPRAAGYGESGSTLLSSDAGHLTDTSDRLSQTERLALVAEEPADQDPASPDPPLQRPTAARTLAQAAPAPSDSLASDAMAQLTSVAQLSDVQPTDWAFQALQSLVERYGVIAGYPDRTFQGNRPLTRYEFAAGLNAALDRLAQLLSTSTENAVTKEDLATIQRLQTEFASELAILRGRVDGLEARTAELEATQFSTTVRLNGEVTLALADAWGGNPPGRGEQNPVLAQLTQLQLSGSFSGRDAFRVTLDASNFGGRGFAEPSALNTNMALLGFQSDSGNQVGISSLEYRFAVGDRLVVTLKPVGFSLSSVLSPNTIYASSSQGALSRFAGEPSVFKIGSLDAGVGFDWLLSDRVRLQVAYGARDASNPEQGILGSDHRAFAAQLLLRPANNLTTGIAYINAFAADGFLDTFTGSNNADTSGGFLEPAAIHAFSGTLQWQITPNLILGAWGGIVITDSLKSDAAALSTTYLFSLGLTDPFGREGDLFAVMVGQPLRLRYGIAIPREDEGAGMHYEAFYRFRVNDYISITPGLFIVTDPGHISSNNTIVVGAVRTTFSF